MELRSRLTRRDDRRSVEASAYRRHYSTARWKRLRAAQLQRQPLCEAHLAVGQVVAARVVNHREPHRGDLALFFDPANLQSVCASCHDGPIQRIEAAGGVSPRVDADGWPVDPRHRSAVSART